MCGHHFLITYDHADDWQLLAEMPIAGGRRPDVADYERQREQALAWAQAYATVYPERAADVRVAYGNCNGSEPPEDIVFAPTGERLAAVNHLLRHALSFYAETSHWRLEPFGHEDQQRSATISFGAGVFSDRGDQARQALAIAEQLPPTPNHPHDEENR